MTLEEKPEWGDALRRELTHIETLQVAFPDDVTLRRIARQIMVCIQLQNTCEEPDWRDFRTVG